MELVVNDGEEVICNSLRELVSTFGDYSRNMLDLKGFYCTLDYNYVYIDKDKHRGFNFFKGKCKTPEPIELFSIRDTPIICPKGCSLCGYMSVSKDIKQLIKEKE